MTRQILTPFGGRPVSAGLLATHALAEAAETPVDKFVLIEDLGQGRGAFGLSDRDIAVLNALLSFHPARQLDPDDKLVVFPSNRALSARLWGMHDSTLRRHIAALCRAGVLLRRDSPNGKRYRVRGADEAYGFDLRPLVAAAGDIAAAADDARQTAEALRQARADVTLTLRDAEKLILWAETPEADWTERLRDLRRVARRKLDGDQMAALLAAAERLLRDVQQATIVVEECDEPEDMHANDGHFARHQQTSKPDPNDYEPCLEKQGGDRDSTDPATEGTATGQGALPFGLVRKACPELALFSGTTPQNWHDFVAAAHRVRPAMGISSSAWDDAVGVMGAVDAAIVVAAMLQRMDSITAPGGYLRALTRKAASDQFSPGPMVMALIRKDAA